LQRYIWAIFSCRQDSEIQDTGNIPKPGSRKRLYTEFWWEILIGNIDYSDRESGRIILRWMSVRQVVIKKTLEIVQNIIQ
jgi:hypothetical protein